MPSEIEAWARLQRLSLEPFEVDILFRLDMAFLAGGSTKLPAGKRDGAVERVAANDAGGLKAMFRSMGARPAGKSRKK